MRGKKEVKLCKRGLMLFNRRCGNTAQSRAQQPQPLGQQYKQVCGYHRLARKAMQTMPCHGVWAQLPWGQEPQGQGKRLSPCPRL